MAIVASRPIEGASFCMPQRPPPERAELNCPLAARTGYRQGLLCNIGNPKAAVIFTSLLPQFVSGPHASPLAFFALGGIFVAIGLTLQVGYAIVAARASRFLVRPGVRRAIERVTGVALIGLGVRLATERR